LDTASHHERLSMATVFAVQELADRINPDCAVILESRVNPNEIAREVTAAKLALGGTTETSRRPDPPMAAPASPFAD